MKLRVKIDEPENKEKSKVSLEGGLRKQTC